MHAFTRCMCSPTGMQKREALNCRKIRHFENKFVVETMICEPWGILLSEQNKGREIHKAAAFQRLSTMQSKAFRLFPAYGFS